MTKPCWNCTKGVLDGIDEEFGNYYFCRLGNETSGDICYSFREKGENDTMKYMLTTDTHFNHAVIKEYCGRPDDYEERIANGFKQLVKDKHVLIHLGDVCIGKETEMHEKYIMPLPVKKILIKGNHDSKSISWYMEHGWDWVCESMTLQRGGKRVLFSHVPIIWDGYYDLNIHGHFHNANHRRFEAELKVYSQLGQRLLALEYNDYQLFDLDKILEGSCNKQD